MMCPMCGGPLYLEASTGDPVCPTCCKMKHGDHYTLLSILTETRDEPRTT